MPAPDLLTIFALEKAIETGFVTIFEAHDIDAVKQRDGGELPVPRVEVQYQNGAEIGHVTRIPSGQSVRDAWDGTIRITVVTNRENTSPATLHDELLARVRLVMRSFQREITRERFPYHEMPNITGQGDQCGVDADNLQDVTTLVFSCTVAVRRDAWPTS
jgi:hypothetical protein